MSEKTSPARPLSHARDITRPGFYVKLVLMALVNAFGVYGIMAAYAQQQWVVLGFVALTLGIADWVYFSKRALPSKYLFPGLVFLAVFQVYVMISTAQVAFTNYGDGHNDTKEHAVTQIMRAADARVPETATFPVTVFEDAGEIGFAIVDEGLVKVGTAEDPLKVDNRATQVDGRVTEISSGDILALPDIQKRQQEVLGLRVGLSDDPEQGWLRTDNGSMAYVAKSLLTYDEDADTFVNAEGKKFVGDEVRGSFVADDGSTLTPGWRVYVGTSNFTRVFTDQSLTGPFWKITGWNFVFAILSVLTTFALGLFLAVIYNDPRVKGRVIYRALFILPYAFPAFLAALVWRGMLNPQFGFVNQTLLQGAGINWLGDGTLAKLSILLVNLWLGFPYMFLVCTGALQAIPGELTEAGVMDGASPWKQFWNITFPLLLVAVAPLLIASFAFNFNNFSLIYMLTGGGPNFPGTPVLIGETDILISMVYAIAFESGTKQYGLASAMSVLIFVVVGLVSWAGFRQTRRLEEMV